MKNILTALKITAISFSIIFGFFVFNISHAFASTFYFNNAVNTDWNNLGNWWTDSGFTTPAGSLPGTGDDAIVTGNVTTNSGPSISVFTLTVNSGSVWVSLTVANGATFNNALCFYNGTVTIHGDVIFNGSSANLCTITGTATFNDTASNSYHSIIQGNAIFNYAHAGVITIPNGGAWGPATILGSKLGDDAVPITSWVFNGHSGAYGNISGDATFNDTSYITNYAVISGTATFNYAHAGVITIPDGGFWGHSVFNGPIVGDDMVPITSWVFRGNSQSFRSINGDAAFYNTSINTNTVTGNACFAATATNSGTVNGTVSVCPPIFMYFNAASDHDWNNLNNWWTDSGFTIPATSLPTSIDDVVIDDYVQTNSGDEPTVNTMTVNGSPAHIFITVTVVNGATFYNQNSIQSSGGVNGDVIFYDSSFNSNGTITGNAIFYNSSNNGGTITGDAIFNDASFNMTWATIEGSAIFNNAHAGIITIPDGSRWGGGEIGGSILGDDELPITSWIFNGDSFNDSTTITGDVVFNGTSYNGEDAVVIGNVIFNDSSYNSNLGSTITGNATFLDTSYNDGTINGDACFAKTATNNGTVTGKITVCGASNVVHHSGSSSASMAYFQSQNLITPTTTEPQLDCKPNYNFNPSTGKPCTTSTNTPPTTNNTSCSITQTLTLWSRGAEVKCLQSKLNLNSDGIFGIKTYSAVVAFQKSHSLKSDGVVGLKTREALK